MKALRNIIILFTLLLCFAPGKATAQNDKIKELRAAFIAKKMEFTSEESTKFWPVYNELQDKRSAIKKNLRQNYRNLSPNFSDKEAEDLIALENKSAAAEAELTKTYNDKLKGIIGARKLVKLQICEEEFKKEVLSALKDK
jgi:hypothetical protein